MNPKLIFTLWSFRNELKFVIFAFLIVLSLPIIAVIILTNTGIDVVSDHLATVNTQNNTVQIHDPATGEVVKEITPVVAWPVSGVVTLDFGQNDLPYQPFHTGIDIADPYGRDGSPIHPFMAGKVIYAGEIFWGFGKHIIIDNGNNVTSIYAHLFKIFVYPGEQVNINQVIGLEGHTGWATGPHLHFQIDVYGIPVNPRTFISNNP